jgi:pteridine reductase
VLWPEQGLDAELKAEIVGKTALRRMGSPEDVARAALYFAADAPFVTGQILAIDGGRSL